MYILFTALSAFSETISFYLIKKIRLPLFLSFYLVLFSSRFFHFFNSKIFETAISFIILLAFSFYSSRKLNISILQSSSTIINVMICGWIVRTLYHHTSLLSNFDINFFLIIGSSIELLFLFLLIHFEKNCYRFFEKRFKPNYLLNITSLISLFLFFLYFYHEFYTEFFLHPDLIIMKSIVTSIFFTFVILLFIIIIITQSTINQREKIEQEKAQILINQQYTKMLEEQAREIKKFKHDFKNILLSLHSEDSSIISQKYVQDIQQQLLEMSKEASFFSDLSNINNLELRNLLYAKMNVAIAAQIQISLEVKNSVIFPQDLLLTLVRVLGILLDNAIEASLELIDLQKESFINITFVKKQHDYQIILKNRYTGCLPSFSQLEQEGFSTKGENRGLGLSNVKILLKGKPILYHRTIKNQEFKIILTILG